MATTSSIGTVFLSPLLLVNDLYWLAKESEMVILLALYLGIATAVAPLIFFAKGLRLIHVSTAATMNLVEPLTATLLGVILLGEQLGHLAWTGMFILAAGMLILSFHPRAFLQKVYTSLISG